MEKDTSNGKSVKHFYKDVSVQDPKARLKSLSDGACGVNVNYNIPPKRYYRSGVEMLRMADVYMDEGSFEEAYFLYMKFLTIFLEKITEHPQYNDVPSKDKALNKQALREVIRKTEGLKTQLLDQYQVECDKYLEELKEKERAEKQRQKREELQRLKEEEEKKNKPAAAKIGKTAIAAAALPDPQEMRNKIVSPIVPKSLVSPIPENKGLSKDKQTPTIDRSTKPALLTDDHTLRDIVVPNELMRNFLTLAFNNTVNNKETCGILAGKLDRNKLLVTHLLIPQQTGSPDSCSTQNEEDIFDYQDRHNLITLGWIHTHPTQTAFLSSVDLHTHCAYQLMMAEAIAIVCAPKYDETGFFILTPEYGLDFIANCKESGFHPHPQDIPLYMRAKHCKLDSTASVNVVDLRKK